MNQLTKSSTSEEIKMYFNAILKLVNSDNEFPINFDEVWMLVYEDKKSAIRELKDKFMQDVDFQMVRKKVQASNAAGYVWSDSYYLTVSCLEYFIARKVRPVFEVYRKVFHKTVTPALLVGRKRSAGLTTKVKASLLWMEGVSKYLNLNDSSKLKLLKQVAEPLGMPTPDYTPSKGTLLSASELLKRAGTDMNARDFNRKMIEAGMMEEKERPSSNKGIKRFKSIIGEGLKFGENQVNPQNPKETQPLYYEEKFAELTSLLAVIK